MQVKLEKIIATNFGGTDRRKLARLLLHCQHMSRKEDREKVIKDLPDEVRPAIHRDYQNDLQDIRGILDTCLEYRGGLKELIAILRDYEDGAESFQKVEEFLEGFLQRTEKQIPTPNELIASSHTTPSTPPVLSDSQLRTEYICYLSVDKLAALFTQVDTKSLEDYESSYRNIVSLPFGEAADRPDNERKRRVIVSQLSLVLDYLERTANIGQLAEILRENGQLNYDWYHLQSVFHAESWKAIDYQVFLLGKIEDYRMRLSCSKSNFPGLSREGDTYIPTSTNAFLFNGDVGLHLKGLVRLINVDLKAKAISGTPLYLVLSTDLGRL